MTIRFNPWIGCTKVAPGCANCYAEADMDKRRGRVKWGPAGTRSKTSDDYWKQPLKWDRAAAKTGVRRRVFCASLADVFEDWDGPIVDHKGRVLLICPDCEGIEPSCVDCTRCHARRRYLTMDDLRRDLFGLIDATPNLDWLVLTKRPENIRRMWSQNSLTRTLELRGKPGGLNAAFVRANIWLYTSVSEQATADENIPELLACRDLVPVLGVSAEPLLGPIQLAPHDEYFDFYFGTHAGIDHVIVGGESGPQSRPCDIHWFESIVDQCRYAQVPCFVKQLGANVFDGEFSDAPDGELSRWLHLKHLKGGDIDEWPESLQVRKWPQASQV